MRYDSYMWDRYGNYLFGIQCIVEIWRDMNGCDEWVLVIYSCECLDRDLHRGMFIVFNGLFWGIVCPCTGRYGVYMDCMDCGMKL